GLPGCVGREQCAVIDGAATRIVARRPDGPPRVALFDLRADPRERRDLSAAQPARAAELERALQAFLERQRAARAAFLAPHANAAATARAPAQDALERLKSLGYLR